MIVEVTRGPAVESSHQVMACVVDESGRAVNSWGNIGYLTFPRSAIKMLQALPLIESGAADKFELNDQEICLACASHKGQKEHLSVLKKWMEKIPLNESQLACGAHMPTHEATAREMIRHNAEPTPAMNNCSGKHTGLLCTCVHLGEKTEGYEKYDHPAQKRLRQVLSETMRIDHNKLPYGIDGCSIVTYAAPLQNIAIGLSALINPKEAELRKAAAKRILQAVTREPFYLSGADDFTTVVNEKTQGRSIVKVGAEGVFAGLIPERGLAFAVKAADGSKRAAEFATAQVLKAYGGMNEAEFTALKNFTQPPVTSWKGEVVGQIRLAKEN
jgi:L-asparaginase II